MGRREERIGLFLTTEIAAVSKDGTSKISEAVETRHADQQVANGSALHKMLVFSPGNTTSV